MRRTQFVTKTCSREEGCVSQALNYLHWPTLQYRRRIARLCLLYKTLNNEAEITVLTYVQHQQLQRTRHSYPLQTTSVNRSGLLGQFTSVTYPKRTGGKRVDKNRMRTPPFLSEFQDVVNSRKLWLFKNILVGICRIY